MDVLTIHEAAETTGWSARMLRYLERIGLVESQRSESGYRLYGPQQLQRLRTLRELLDRFDLTPGDVGFALALRRDAELAGEVDAWLRSEAERPGDVEADDWLGWEQHKHQALLAAAHPSPHATEIA